MYFFFNDTATTEIYTLSLHDALPISRSSSRTNGRRDAAWIRRKREPCSRFNFSNERLGYREGDAPSISFARSEEHTSELQSRGHLVCRLLLEKKKNTINILSRSVINT